MDRIRIQHQFRRVLWTCPSCKQEDFEDRNMSGGDSYIHTCSACKFEFNQSCGQMKEYNGCLTYSPEEYEKLAEQDISAAKDKVVSAWVEEIKKPVVEYKPTAEELEKQILDKQAEIDTLTSQKLAIEEK